jgi:hypothetical protein
MKSELSVYREKDGTCSIMRGKKALAVGLSDDDALAMAAGRELLAACRAAMDYFNETRSGREWRDSGGEEPSMLAAAIAKAEGRA